MRASEQPGLWCHWTPNEAGTAIVWDGVERFFYYDHWLKYIIDHFLVPWGYVLNGAVKWQGYYRGDRGTLRVRQNQVERNTQWPND